MEQEDSDQQAVQNEKNAVDNDQRIVDEDEDEEDEELVNQDQSNLARWRTKASISSHSGNEAKELLGESRMQRDLTQEANVPQNQEQNEEQEAASKRTSRWRKKRISRTRSCTRNTQLPWDQLRMKMEERSLSFI